MVELLKDYTTQIYHALSTDTPPTVDPGAQLWEIDTGKRYIFDGTSWQELPDGSGGGYIANDWADPTKPVGEITTPTITAATEAAHEFLLARRTGITKVDMGNSTVIPVSFFQYSSLSALNAPLVTTVYGAGLGDLESIPYVVLPALQEVKVNGFVRSSGIIGVDFGGTPNANGMKGNQTMAGCAKLKDIVLRATAIWPIASNALSQTPFASGGAGGDIYIPKSLYDHLGDGSALDYKAAANWSTLDGYGTITWHAIEGSIYETQYVDGTPIS